MVKAIRFYETGGPEVLKLEELEVGEPGPGQARVRHSLIAVNFIDIYFRTGRYPLALPERAGLRCGRRGRGRGAGRDRHPRGRPRRLPDRPAGRVLRRHA